MRRSTWYGLSTSTPTAGAATSTIATAATAIAPSAAKWVHLVPATNSTARAIARYTSPEPRSGWPITSIAGISVNSMILLVVSRSSRRLILSTTKPDSDSTSNSFPSSEAWKLMKPSSMARFEPRAENPSA